LFLKSPSHSLERVAAAEHAYQLQRLDKGDFDAIVANSDYKTEVARNIPNGFNWEQI